jgi:hypothetical protein
VLAGQAGRYDPRFQYLAQILLFKWHSELPFALVDTTTRVAYFSVVTHVRQQTNARRSIRPASPGERKIAGLVFAGTVAFFGGLWLLQEIGFDFGLLFGPCGMKQRTGLPCPTCGMTTSVLAFARGRVLWAFYVQPAAGLMCTLLVAAAFLAFLAAAFGVYFSIFDRLLAKVRLRDVLLGLLIVLAAGWAVTLARALASQN